MDYKVKGSSPKNNTFYMTEFFLQLCIQCISCGYSSFETFELFSCKGVGFHITLFVIISLDIVYHRASK